MKLSRQMHPRRLLILMRNDIQSQLKPIVLTTGAAFSLMIVALVISLYVGLSRDFYSAFFCMTLVGGGIVLTSLSFSELHYPLRGIAYLMVPGSLPEKYLSKLLLTSVGYAGATILFFYVFSFLVALVARILLGSPLPVFHLGEGCTLGALGFYFCIHPVFFFGSIYFRRYAFFGTVLSAVVYLLVLLALMVFAAWSLFAGDEGAIALHNLVSNLGSHVEVYGPMIVPPMKWLIRLVFPLFFLALTYLRLTEYEVNHAV